MGRPTTKVTAPAPGDRLLNAAQKEYLRKLKNAANSYDDTELRMLIHKTLVQMFPEYVEDPSKEDGRELRAQFDAVFKDYALKGLFRKSQPQSMHDLSERLESGRNVYFYIVESNRMDWDYKIKLQQTYDVFCEKLMSKVAELGGATVVSPVSRSVH
jgi:hypothetical protein